MSVFYALHKRSNFTYLLVLRRKLRREKWRIRRFKNPKEVKYKESIRSKIIIPLMDFTFSYLLNNSIIGYYILASFGFLNFWILNFSFSDCRALRALPTSPLSYTAFRELRFRTNTQPNFWRFKLKYIFPRSTLHTYLLTYLFTGLSAWCSWIWSLSPGSGLVLINSKKECINQRLINFENDNVQNVQMQNI